MANLWTEFSAHRRDALIPNVKEPQNLNKLVVAATFGMAKERIDPRENSSFISDKGLD
jgi:hypothetical protein